MVHTLRFSEEEEEKFSEIYGDSNLNFSTIVKKRIFNTHTENIRRNESFFSSMGKISSYLNMLENYNSDMDKISTKILTLINKEVEHLWQNL